MDFLFEMFRFFQDFGDFSAEASTRSEVGYQPVGGCSVGYQPVGG